MGGERVYMPLFQSPQRPIHSVFVLIERFLSSHCMMNIKPVIYIVSLDSSCLHKKKKKKTLYLATHLTKRIGMLFNCSAVEKLFTI